MPGADGLEVTKHIRKILNYNKEQTLIILSSAAIADKDDLLHYKSLGVDALPTQTIYRGVDDVHIN